MCCMSLHEYKNNHKQKSSCCINYANGNTKYYLINLELTIECLIYNIFFSSLVV
eukprot:UN19157